jgi:hypothetical protein
MKHTILLLVFSLLAYTSFCQEYTQANKFSLGLHVGMGTGIEFQFQPNPKFEAEISLEAFGLFRPIDYSGEMLYSDSIFNVWNSFYGVGLNFNYMISNPESERFALFLGIGIQGRRFNAFHFNRQNESLNGIIIEFPPHPGRMYSFGLVPSMKLSYDLSKHLSLFTNIGGYIDLRVLPLLILPRGNVGLSFGF